MLFFKKVSNWKGYRALCISEEHLQQPNAKLISTLNYIPVSGILDSGRLSCLFSTVLYFKLPSLDV